MQDVFHKDQSAPLSDVTTNIIREVKEKAEALYETIDTMKKIEMTKDREKQDGEMIARYILAQRKLEECVMWAVKGLTK